MTDTIIHHGAVWSSNHTNDKLATRRAKRKGRKVWLEQRRITPAHRGGWRGVWWDDCPDAETAKNIMAAFLHNGISAVRALKLRKGAA